MSTVNPDGSPVRIEAVYWQHFRVCAHEVDSIEEAVSFLEDGEGWGSLASVGVFVEGRPRRVESEWGLDRGRTDEQMLEEYAQIGQPAHRVGR